MIIPLGTINTPKTIFVAFSILLQSLVTLEGVDFNLHGWVHPHVHVNKSGIRVPLRKLDKTLQRLPGRPVESEHDYTHLYLSLLLSDKCRQADLPNQFPIKLTSNCLKISSLSNNWVDKVQFLLQPSCLKDNHTLH